MYTYYVYILANRKHGTLYIGVTSDLVRRVLQHKSGKSAFTKRYGIARLVYFEQTNDVYVAIEREKQLKWWKRQWKIAAIEKDNFTWRDLYSDIAAG